MATLNDFMDLKKNDQGAKALDEMLVFAGPKATGGPHRASIFNLPVVMDTSMSASFAMMYGVKADEGQDPILALKDKLFLTGKYAPVAEVAVVPERSIDEVRASSAELEELVALRAEKIARELANKERISRILSSKAANKLAARV